VQMTQAFVQWAPLLVKSAQLLMELGEMASWAARKVGLLESVTLEQKYQDLLEQRLAAQERLDKITRTSLGASEAQIQAEVHNKLKLLEIDKQLTAMRERMGAAQKADAASARPAITGEVQQTPEQAASAKRASVSGKAEADWLDKINLQAAERARRIEQSYMTEAELERANYERKLYDLILAAEQDILTEQQYNDLRQQAEQQHQAKLGNIAAQGAIQRRQFDQMTAKQQTQFVLGELLNMTNGVAAHNKTMFNINKAAGIANAIINTSLGVTKALSAYPPPISIAMAAVQLVAGMAQVRAIKSAQFGSSTSAPSVGGGSAVPTTPAGDFSGVPSVPGNQQREVPKRNVTIVLRGEEMLSADYIRNRLIPAINEATGDGVSLTAA
jgi:hypothetical protein